MKLVISTLVMALAATPLAAQTTPAPAATATAPSTKLTIDTPIETIAASPAGKAVLDKDLPGMTAHPMYDQFKSMSLSALQPMSQGQITDAQIAAVKADLAALK